MKFRLVFYGDLRPKQQIGLAEVHRVREQFRPQLRNLWRLTPLSESGGVRRLPPTNGDIGIFENVSGVTFAPLVTARWDTYAELEVFLIRQSSNRSVLQDGGDIDNRLKTLFDALRMPTSSEVQTLRSQSPDVLADTDAYDVLLQDDALVTKVSAESDRLLDASIFADQYGAVPSVERMSLALITVTIKLSRTTFGNIGLSS